jgi:hypothetical protein
VPCCLSLMHPHCQPAISIRYRACLRKAPLKPQWITLGNPLRRAEALGPRLRDRESPGQAVLFLFGAALLLREAAPQRLLRPFALSCSVLQHPRDATAAREAEALDPIRPTSARPQLYSRGQW